MAVTNGDRKKTGKKDQTTLRFDLELNSPTQDSFSEFSFLQLVSERKKEQKVSIGPAANPVGTATGLAGLDSNLDSNHLAKNLEEKYGSKPPKKKQKRIVNDSDYIDRGYGYDLNDPFVDDSEFYEDFVPDNVDTKFGGFYVNTGELQFKAADNVDDMDFVVKKKPTIKKQPSHQTPQAILASQKLKKAKQHAALHKAPCGKKRLFLSKPTIGHVSIEPPPSKKPHKELSTKVKHTSSLPVVPISIGEKSIFVPIFPTPKEGTVLSPEKTCVVSGQERIDDPAVDKPPPVLPNNLPFSVQNVVTKLTTKINADQQGGKVTNKQREAYTDILLEVEFACKIVQMKIRNGVFEYLAHLLGVARGTLTKRMKQLAKKKKDDALNDLILKLKNAIEQSMPKQIVMYEEELTKARSESLSLSADKVIEVDEDTRTDDVFNESSLLPGSHSGGASLPGDQVLPNQATLEQVEGSTPKQKRLPRKKYRWSENDEVKRLLCEVIRVKVGIEEKFCRLNKEKGEDVISQFLEDKIKPFWPKGWMQRSVLYKITEAVHRNYTSSLPKKGVTVIKKEKQPIILAKKRLESSPQQFKKVPKSLYSSSTSAESTVDVAVSPRLMGVVQNMLTSSHDLNSRIITSTATLSLSKANQPMLNLPSTQISSIATSTSALSTQIVNAKSLGAWSLKTAAKQPALNSDAIHNLERATTTSSVFTSNPITTVASSIGRCLKHNTPAALITTKQNTPASVVLSTPVVSIAKLSYNIPARAVFSAKLQNTAVCPLGTISSVRPLFNSQVSRPLPTYLTDSSGYSTNLSGIPKTSRANNLNSLLSTTSTTPIPSPQVCFSSIIPTKATVGVHHAQVSREQPPNNMSLPHPRPSVYPLLSQSQTVICSPTVKSNTLSNVKQHKNSHEARVGNLVRSPVEQIFEEHCYLKTGSASDVDAVHVPNSTSTVKQ